MTGNVIGWLGLAASLIFVVIALVLTASQRLQLTKPIVIAVVRALVQMTIVGVALVPIVDPDTPLAWSWLWVAGIIVFSTVTIARRASRVPGLWRVALLANLIVAAVGLSLVFGFGIFALEGRALVPVAGMLIGNSMKAAVVGANRVSEASSEHRAEIEAGLALGMSVTRASRRVVRSALRTALTPQIEQTASLGLVFLPGAMTGLILAGVDPLEAVRAQLALMFVILAGTVIAVTVTGLGTLRLLTTERQTIRHLARQ